MRRIFGTLTVLLFAAVLVVPQGMAADHDDHDDNAPVQSGFAIVTATTSGAPVTGLVVFETFGMRHGLNGATQAGLLPPALTTNALLFVDSEGRLSKNLAVAIVNPNPSPGPDANVGLMLWDDKGKQVATTTLKVPAHQQISEFVTQLFPGPSSVPSDFIGTLGITSSIPVSVIGLRFRGQNFSTLPVTNLAPASLPNNVVVLPQFAAGGGWATELVLGNTNSGAIDFRVDLFKPNGSNLTTTLNGTTADHFTGSIPANGVFVLAPRDPHGDDDF
jgi:hypothetical protein